MIVAVIVAAAGAAGATSRFLVDSVVQARTSGGLPFGTLTVNVVGSLIMGVVTGLALFHGLTTAPKAIVGTGFCGGLTTWSTASWETVQLAGHGRTRAAMTYALGGLAASVAAAAAGIALMAVL
jgi:fluoride exporter